ncbi:MAG: hypothetical protein AAFS04_02240 [Cyanobacteria bacterium J06631_9]
MARKKLNADVRAFLRGDQADETPQTAPTPKDNEHAKAAPAVSTPISNKEAGNEGLLADILGPDQQSEAVVRYTADLPESLHQRLSYAAVKNKTTKIKLLRQILDKVLPDLPT